MGKGVCGLMEEFGVGPVSKQVDVGNYLFVSLCITAHMVSVFE